MKSYDNLTFLIVLKAGHLAPTDQPEVAFEMIQRFIEKKGFTED